MGARWITYTLLMLVVAVIIALLLPTQYSLGLLGTLGYILQVIIPSFNHHLCIATLLYHLAQPVCSEHASPGAA